jgi:hypothetical protein
MLTILLILLSIIYAAGFIIFGAIYLFIETFGYGNTTHPLWLIIETLLFAAFWPITVWFINKN